MNYILIFVFSGFFFLSQAQLTLVDSILSKNQITEYRGQKLILIDVWATWCMPCIPATRQLEILQESVYDKVYMISLSDEKPEVMSRFLEKKPIRLAVVSDYSQPLVKRYQIQSRPYAILIDYTGKTLWTGKPSDLTAKMIDKFAANVKGQNTLRFDQILRQHPPKPPVPSQPKINPYQDADLVAHYIKDCPEIIPPINAKSYEFCGKFQDFLLDFYQIPSYQCEPNPLLDKYILVHIGPNMLVDSQKRGHDLITKICTELKIDLDISPVTKEGIELFSHRPEMLWDSTQIDWGATAPKYLVGTPNIQANNVTVAELAAKLSNITKKIYFYRGSDQRHYDWDFSYEVEHLMRQELESSFGIKSGSTPYTFSFLRFSEQTP